VRPDRNKAVKEVELMATTKSRTQLDAVYVHIACGAFVTVGPRNDTASSFAVARISTLQSANGGVRFY
jgi:hypothetical protein